MGNAPKSYGNKILLSIMHPFLLDLVAYLKSKVQLRSGCPQPESCPLRFRFRWMELLGTQISPYSFSSTTLQPLLFIFVLVRSFPWYRNNKTKGKLIREIWIFQLFHICNYLQHITTRGKLGYKWFKCLRFANLSFPPLPPNACQSHV